MQKYRVFGLAVLFGAVSLTAPFMTGGGRIAAVTESQEPTEQTAEDTTMSAEDKAASRAERLKAYQEKAAEKLTAAKAERVASRCKAAQGKITSLRARMEGVVANRKKVYKEIGEKLDALVLRLQVAGLDTTALETAIADIKVDLSSLSTAMESFDTVLSDLETMDCVADPDAFSSALTSARETQTQLREQAAEFRRFASTELKAIIQELKAQLAQATQETPSQEQVTEPSGDQ